MKVSDKMLWLSEHTKYKQGEMVIFLQSGINIKGEIMIVDARGCFEYPNEISYDIYAEDHCLYKHIRESDIVGLA